MLSGDTKANKQAYLLMIQGRKKKAGEPPYSIVYHCIAQYSAASFPMFSLKDLTAFSTHIDNIQ